MNEIVAAIYNRLSGLPVFDHVPDNQNYPFIRIDPINTSNRDTDETLQFLGSFQIVIYSDYKGNKELYDLGDQVYNLLNRWQMPDTANWQVTGITHLMDELLLDHKIRYRVQRYEIIFNKK